MMAPITPAATNNIPRNNRPLPRKTVAKKRAWALFNAFLFGYTDSMFMDGDIFPNILDFWGPSGMKFVRDPQIRWTPWMQTD